MQQPSPTPSLQKPPPDDVFGVPKQIWIITGVLSAVLIISYLGYVAWDKNRELKEAKIEADGVRADKVKSDTEASNLKEKLENSLAQIAALEKEKAAVVQTHRSLEDEMRAALESKDVTISKLQGKLTVNILDRIMFESGEAVLKPDGEAVLLKVGTILTQHPTLKVHVIGHTDNVPIRAGAQRRFASNWELSTARATAAVRYLTDKAGVDPRQLGALGYGEFRPVADNSTKEGRAKNRRIAISILSEELAGSDAPAAITVTNTILPVVSTNGTLPSTTNVVTTVPSETGTDETNSPAAE